MSLSLQTAADLPDDDESERKRRATSEDDLSDNGFVTVCEARFIPSSSASNTLLLVWACPDGVAAPGDDDEVAICDLLIDQRLVSSCTSHRGTVDLPPAPYLPPTRFVWGVAFMDVLQLIKYIVNLSQLCRCIYM